MDRSPRVVEEARKLVDGALHDPAQLGIADDPLAVKGLSRGAVAPLVQYRHEFLRNGGGSDSWLRPYKEEALRPVPVRTVLELGKETARLIDAAGPSQGIKVSLTDTLVVTPLRERLWQLEAWHAKSGLSDSATLAALEAELRTRVPIPGTDQSVPLDQCLLFVALAIAGVQLVLASLLATLRANWPPADALDRSWIVLQPTALARVLTLGWLVAPALAWLTQVALRTLPRNQLPSSGDWLLAILLLATTTAVVWQARLIRRKLSAPSQSATPAQPIIPTRARAA
jgi:hypothetical protein